jgi:hypothetical protein
MKMFSEKPISEWAEVLDKFDLPHDYEITFTAFSVKIFFLFMPEIVAYNVAYGITHLVLNPEQASYVILQYLPEFRKSIKGAVFVETKV